jgi:hypothetical protein
LATRRPNINGTPLEPVHDLGLIFFFQEKGSMFVDFLLNFDDFSGGVKFLETSPKIGKVGVFGAIPHYKGQN